VTLSVAVMVGAGVFVGSADALGSAMPAAKSGAPHTTTNLIDFFTEDSLFLSVCERNRTVSVIS
jgi:hypothetical protein